MRIPKDYRPLIAAAREEGWTVSQTGGGHLRIASPGGGTVVFAPSTPSNHRGLICLRLRLRKAGVPV